MLESQPLFTDYMFAFFSDGQTEVYWQLLWEAIMGKIPVKSELDSIKGEMTCSVSVI